MHATLHQPCQSAIDMSRNIVVCLDGTKNEYSAANTNVVRLFELLERESPQQLCYYQTGVGTTTPTGMWDAVQRWLVTKLDLAFAILLKGHVLDAYTFPVPLLRERRPHLHLRIQPRCLYRARTCRNDPQGWTAGPWQ